MKASEGQYWEWGSSKYPIPWHFIRDGLLGAGPTFLSFLPNEKAWRYEGLRFRQTHVGLIPGPPLCTRGDLTSLRVRLLISYS